MRAWLLAMVALVGCSSASPALPDAGEEALPDGPDFACAVPMDCPDGFVCAAPAGSPMCLKACADDQGCAAPAICFPLPNGGACY